MSDSVLSLSPPQPIKITFVGDATVGKTSFVSRLVNKTFSANTMSTIGAAFFAMRYPNASGEVYHVWDTAGQERYNALIPLYLNDASVIVVVYDITSRESFERLADHWFPFIAKNMRVCRGAAPLLFLLGNKVDLTSAAGYERAVSAAEAQAFADEHDMLFAEASAKTGGNIEDVFQTIHVKVRRRSDGSGDDADIVRLISGGGGGDGSCCFGGGGVAGGAPASGVASRVMERLGF